MKTILINCSGVGSTDELWLRYLEATKPDDGEDFGCNLDAFWDAIEGGGPGWPGEVMLVFQHTKALSELRTAGGASFLEELRKIAKQAARIKVQLS